MSLLILMEAQSLGLGLPVRTNRGDHPLNVICDTRFTPSERSKQFENTSKTLSQTAGSFGAI